MNRFTSLTICITTCLLVTSYKYVIVITCVVTLSKMASTAPVFSSGEPIKAGARCTPKDPRFTFDDCMMDKKNKYLWCDQSNYTKIPNEEQIRKFPLGGDCKFVKALYINDSCLTTLTKDDLSKFLEIELFYADKNELRELRRSTFEGNQFLVSVDFCHNKIEEVEDESFKGLEKLEKLHLDNNRISRIPERMFHGLSSLQILTLSNNQISVIQRDHYKHLTGLRVLRITGNRISHIQEFSFEPLNQLTHLHLDGNEIQDISANTFSGLENLEMLTISHNRIHTWPEEYGALFSNVHTMNLGSNLIEDFKSAHVRNMSKLQNLSLENNSLKAIEEDIFKSNSRLRFLNLSSNFLEEIPPKTFETLCYLETLILRKNSLKTPHKEWFEHVFENKDEQNLTDIADNLWECNCDAINFHNYLEEKMEKGNEDVQKLAKMIRIRCYSPKFAKDEVLDEDIRHEIEFRKQCRDTAENSEKVIATTPCSEEPSSGCNSTPSFTIIPYATEIQYHPMPKALEMDDATIDKAETEPVDSTVVNLIIVIFCVFLVGVVSILIFCLVKRNNSEKAKEKKESQDQQDSILSETQPLNSRTDEDQQRQDGVGESMEDMSNTHRHEVTVPKYTVTSSSPDHYYSVVN